MFACSLGAAYGITNQNEFSSRRIDAYEYTFADTYDGTYFKDDIGLIAFRNEIPNTPSVQLSPFPASQLTGTQLYTAGWCVLTLSLDLALKRVLRGRLFALRYAHSPCQQPARFLTRLFAHIPRGLTETQYTSGSSDVFEVLKYAAVPFISNADCGRIYNSWGIVAPPSSHICAGGVKADACQGDSGGPLSIEAAAYPTPGYTSNIQVGITSHGPTPCGGPSNVGAYTDVNQYLRWINDEIWYNNWEGTSIPTVKNTQVSPSCYTGAVVSTTSLPSGGDCCKACKENPSCGSWNYQGTQCMQHAMGGFSKGTGVCASGWLNREDTPDGVQSQQGFFEYPSASLKVDTLAVSAGGCAVACQNQDGCKYYTYIGPIGGSQTYNAQGANCQLASADGAPQSSTRFSNAVSGRVDGDSPVPVPSPEPSPQPSPEPSPMPSPMPSPSPPPPANVECSFRSGTYVIRNVGTSCSDNYLRTWDTNCRSTSVTMRRGDRSTASEFVLKNTNSGATITAVKSCRTANKKVTVSNKNSRKTSAYLSRYTSTWRFVSWEGRDCSTVAIQSIGRSRRGYSSYLSRSRSCSRKNVFVSSRQLYSAGAWELTRVSSSTETTRK